MIKDLGKYEGKIETFTIHNVTLHVPYPVSASLKVTVSRVSEIQTTFTIRVISDMSLLNNRIVTTTATGKNPFNNVVVRIVHAIKTGPLSEFVQFVDTRESYFTVNT